MFLAQSCRLTRNVFSPFCIGVTTNSLHRVYPYKLPRLIENELHCSQETTERGVVVSYWKEAAATNHNVTLNPKRFIELNRASVAS